MKTALICFITDQVLFKSELTESSLSWKYFSGKFDEKIVVLFMLSSRLFVNMLSIRVAVDHEEVMRVGLQTEG